MEDFTVIIEEGEDDFFISEVVELPGCHTQAKSIDKLVERTREAISLYIECEGKSDIKNRFLGIQKIHVGV